MEGVKEAGETNVLMEEEGEEIMECDMEIEDNESPEASDKETTPTPTPISVAASIPSTASSVLPDKGQKVNQALQPSSQEISKCGEDDEPLPPGVEEEGERESSEPLPPGMEDSEGALITTKDSDTTVTLPENVDENKPSSVTQEKSALEVLASILQVVAFIIA